MHLVIRPFLDEYGQNLYGKVESFFSSSLAVKKTLYILQKILKSSKYQNFPLALIWTLQKSFEISWYWISHYWYNAANNKEGQKWNISDKIKSNSNIVLLFLAIKYHFQDLDFLLQDLHYCFRGPGFSPPGPALLCLNLHFHFLDLHYHFQYLHYCFWTCIILP